MSTRLEPVANWIDQLKTAKPVNGMIRIECREKFCLPVDTAMRSVSFVPTKNESDESGPQVIEGMASSTSVDSYGTEMSREALLSMQIQMERGIPVLPRHNNGLSGAVEWDQVIGRTVRAQVERSDVVNPAEMGVEQYVLRVQSQLYDDDDKAKSLLNRLTNGQQIGQSIGGWFVSVRVMTNEAEEVERVIIDEVELDHLAITRAPANPDSNSLYTLRSRLEDALFPPVVAERKIASITVNNKCADQMREDMSGSSILEQQDSDDGTVTFVFSTDPDGEHLYYEDSEEIITELSESVAPNGRAVVPYKDLSLAEMGTTWSWDTETQNAVLGDDNWSRYKSAHVWFDPDNQETKSGYKLPIATLEGGELKAVFRGVQAAMAALNGARGGVNIPEDQREDVYNHLVRYYKKADKDPPDLKTNLSVGDIALHDELNDTIRKSDQDKTETIAMPDTTETVTIRTNLDESTETVQDDKCQSDIPMSPVDAHRSASPVNPATNEDEPMTESDLNKIQDMLTSAVSGLAQRIQAIEDVATTSESSAVEPPDEKPTEIEQLHVRLERAETALSNIASKPVRRGRPVHTQQGPGLVSAFDALIERSKSDGGPPTLTSIVERHKVAIADEMGDSKLTTSQLQQLLAAGMRAAERDGLICKSNNSDWQ